MLIPVCLYFKHMGFHHYLGHQVVSSLYEEDSHGKQCLGTTVVLLVVSFCATQNQLLHWALINTIFYCYHSKIITTMSHSMTSTLRCMARRRSSTQLQAWLSFSSNTNVYLKKVKVMLTLLVINVYI